MRVVIPAYPAFNIYSRIARKTTALGPVCVATCVKEMGGWDVEVIDENNFRRYGPRNALGKVDHRFIQEQRPADVVGFYGGLTSIVPRLYEVAGFYKSAGALTIAGGQHFIGQNIEEALSSGIDYVVTGEGEETIKELLAALVQGHQPGRVSGIAYLEGGRVVNTAPRPPLTDFDRLPLPDFGLVRYAKIKLYPVERIRGCGMNCEFCTVKGRPRAASAARLLEQISRLVETVNARQFFIVDDLFGQHRAQTMEFCKMLAVYQKRIGRRLHLTAQIRLDKARDHELLAAMRQAGITTVAIGFESPIGRELEVMNKNLRPEDMLALARVFRRNGFWVHGMFIFGYPALPGKAVRISAQQRIKLFRRFIRKAKIDTLQVLLPVPLPGTELRKRLAAEGRIYLKDDVGWEYYDGTFPLFRPDEPLTAGQMQKAARKLMGKSYRFRHMFLIATDILSFPAFILFMGDIKRGWAKWYRKWHKSVIHFGGWITVRNWTMSLKKNGFSTKLQKAEERLKQDAAVRQPAETNGRLSCGKTGRRLWCRNQPGKG